MTECIFCKIIEGSLPSAKIYEDEHAIAFMNIMPVTKGHILLIPKKHLENVFEFSEEEAAQFFKSVPKIANALKDEFEPAGMNLLQNNGAPAGQAVFHFHLHFIPRYDKSDGFQPSFSTKEAEFDSNQLQELAANLRNKILQ